MEQNKKRKADAECGSPDSDEENDFDETTVCGNEGETGLNCDCDICVGASAINNEPKRLDIIIRMIEEGNYSKKEIKKLVDYLKQ
jgi:hypothetical protein